MSEDKQKMNATGTASALGIDRTTLSGTSDKTTPLASRTAGTMGVVHLKTWKCKPCELLVLQGDPCPKCDKQLLLG